MPGTLPLHVRKRKGAREGMEEFEVRRTGMLTTEEWCDPVSKMLHHMERCSVATGLSTRGFRLAAAFGSAL